MKPMTEQERRAFVYRLRNVFGFENEPADDLEIDSVERTWRWADENPERAKGRSRRKERKTKEQKKESRS